MKNFAKIPLQSIPQLLAHIVGWEDLWGGIKLGRETFLNNGKWLSEWYVSKRALVLDHTTQFNEDFTLNSNNNESHGRNLGLVPGFSPLILCLHLTNLFLEIEDFVFETVSEIIELEKLIIKIEKETPSLLHSINTGNRLLFFISTVKVMREYNSGEQVTMVIYSLTSFPQSVPILHAISRRLPSRSSTRSPTPWCGHFRRLNKCLSTV